MVVKPPSSRTKFSDWDSMSPTGAEWMGRLAFADEGSADPSAFALAAAQPQEIAGAASQVFINEFHYDNVGTDAGERIEIVAPVGVDISGYSLVRYNGGTSGANATTYGTTLLSTITPTTVNGVSYYVIVFPIDGLQNGSFDGFALVRDGTVVQLLSYEGVFTAATGATGGPAAGLTSTDVGVSESNTTTPVGFSLQLTGTGDDYGDFTWATAADDTFGDTNNAQTINFAPPLTPTGPGSFSIADASVVEAMPRRRSPSPLRARPAASALLPSTTH